MWEPGLPKPLTVDEGNEMQADREALKLGITTKAILAQKHLGMHYREMDKQREIELRETIATAQAISRDFPALPFDQALELLEQRSPNPVVRKPQAPAGPAKPAAAGAAKSDPITINVGGNGRRRIEFKRGPDGAMLSPVEMIEE